MSELHYNSWYFPPARQKITSRCCVFVSPFFSWLVFFLPMLQSQARRPGTVFSVRLRSWWRRLFRHLAYGRVRSTAGEFSSAMKTQAVEHVEATVLWSRLHKHAHIHTHTHTFKFNLTHINTTCSHTYKHTKHPPTVCCGGLGVHTHCLCPQTNFNLHS